MRSIAAVVCVLLACTGRAGADVPLDDFESPDSLDNWQFYADPGAVGGVSLVPGGGANGSTGARLSFDFKNGGKYVSMARDIDHPNSYQGISFRLRGYPAGAAVNVRMMDSTGEMFQIRVHLENRSGGWHHYRMLTGGGLSYWGGNQDGIFDGGIQRIMILLGKNIGYHLEGSILVDDVSLIEGRNVDISPFETSPANAIFTGDAGDRLGVSLHLFGPYEDIVEKAHQAGFGFGRTCLAWNQVEAIAGSYDFGPYDRLLDQLESRGMGALFLVAYGNKNYYDGNFDWDTDRRAGAWGPASNDYRQAYVNYAREAAQHFEGHNVVLEIWNEPNGRHFWQPDPDSHAYGMMLRDSLSAIESVAPSMPVMCAGIAAGNASFPMESLGYIRELFSYPEFYPEFRDDLDYVSVHCHRKDVPPETVYTEGAGISEAVADLAGKPDIDLIYGEWGYTTASLGGDLDRQAIFAVRELLLGLLRGVKKIVYYDIRNDATGNPYEDNFGLLENDLDEKPAFRAVKTMNALRPPGTCTAYRVDTRLGHLFGMLFDCDTCGSLAVLWESRPATPETIRILSPTGHEQFFDMYGDPHPGVGCSASECTFTLGEEEGPVYIKIPADEADRDGDGFPVCRNDCDDTDPLIHPGAGERCNGLDDDCNGEVPADEVDADSDGYMACANDCDDTDPLIHPGAGERCNGIDDDCNGSIDEGCACTEGETRDCGTDEGACEFGTQVCTGGVWGSCLGGVIPFPEICNGVDDDCNGEVPADEVDADSDGYMACANDCDDGDPLVNPGAAEACNNIDDDCDESTDEDWPDLGDACTQGIGACEATGTIVCRADGSGAECDAVPGRPTAEDCGDHVDNDCDGLTDVDDAEECGKDGVSGGCGCFGADADAGGSSAAAMLVIALMALFVNVAGSSWKRR